MNQKNYINHLKTSRNKISELFGKRQKSSQAKKFQAWAKLGYLKIICSEKATKFCKISTLLLSTVNTEKSKVDILQNFLAFSEYMNFTK